MELLKSLNMTFEVTIGTQFPTEDNFEKWYQMSRIMAKKSGLPHFSSTWKSSLFDFKCEFRTEMVNSKTCNCLERQKNKTSAIFNKSKNFIRNCTQTRPLFSFRANPWSKVVTIA